MTKIVKQISLNSKRDAALLAEIDLLPKGAFSKTVRDALVAYFKLGGGVTLGLLYQELQAIKQRLDNGAMVAKPQLVDEADVDVLSADILGAFD